MIEWANQNNGFIMAVLTLVYVVATLVLVGITTRANRIALNGQKLQEQLELLPSEVQSKFDFSCGLR